MSVERWVVGPEHDGSLFVKLGHTLRSLGYKLGPEWTAIGGSQEISNWEVSSESGTLVIESETYIGLSVTGPAALVQQLQFGFQAA